MTAPIGVHSALSLVEALLSPHCKEALTGSDHCLTWFVDRERHCKNLISIKRRGDAAKTYGLLLDKQCFPSDIETLELVAKYLHLQHCHTHRHAVLESLEKWKLDNVVKKVSGDATVKIHNWMSASSPTQVTSTTQGESDMPRAVQKGLETTPLRNPTRGPEDDTMSENFSELTISPGQESTISFSDASVASTAFTTPDATPMSFNDFSLAAETDSRPATPCPAPRLPSEPVLDQDLEENPEVKEICDQEDKKGPGMKVGFIRRLKTQRRGKAPLVLGIQHDWTQKDHESGKVYIFKHNKQHDLIKIGFTTSNARARHAQGGNCYATCSTTFWESKDAFVGAYRVEQLVQKQLHDSNLLNYQGNCISCGSAHQEWFRYDSEKAIALIKVWTDFVTGDFYDVGVELDGTKYGQLSQKGLAFMDSVCNLNIEVLKQHIGTEVTSCSEIAEAAEEVIPATTHAGSDDASAMANSTAIKESGDEPNDVVRGGNETIHTATENKQEKHGARWHVKQIFEIKVHEIKELVPKPVRHAWKRRREGADDSCQANQSGMGENMHKFFNMFYTNELNESEEGNNIQSKIQRA